MFIIIPIVLVLMAGFIFWWVVKVNQPKSGEIKVNQAKEVYEILSLSQKKDRKSNDSHEHRSVQEASHLESDQPSTIDVLPESGLAPSEESLENQTDKKDDDTD